MTDTLTAVIDTGTNPAEIAVVSALNRAYVGDLTDGTLTVLETLSAEIVDTITLAHPVAAVRANQTTRTVYALDFSNGTGHSGPGDPNA